MNRWVSFQIDEIMLNQFDKLCSQRRISRSEYLRLLVEWELIKTARQRSVARFRQSPDAPVQGQARGRVESGKG